MGEMITIPLDEYKRLQGAAHDLEDIRILDRVTAALAAGHEETIPAEYVARMVGGESPVRVWREYRGLSQAALAKESGVNRVQILDIEAGRSSGSIATLKKLADALNVALDDLA
ncbi:helix-turn-helix transcriptional regulator [Sphingobium sp. PNB]|uniref:helix-turn-helix transcriptional regulator n=1 Tax=Sphingobium sp. PNB TaxID=863934 RepID=UPI001CA3CFF8|nr:helix-turn-helix transcriptional regulator [Sphingobium sp. PNB]MCB4860796.1 helix-turn-helix transcriptional regulator [Sphingobium sp. PNB]